MIMFWHTNVRSTFIFKANCIKHSYPNEFISIHLCLGGFHQLMSFLGAGYKLLEGSGIEELWERMYAKHSIPKMMTGKAYIKCLRAWFLTDAALHLTLMKSFLCDQYPEDKIMEVDYANISNEHEACTLDREDLDVDFHIDEFDGCTEVIYSRN